MDRITIISGEKHSGKTTKLLELISDLEFQNKKCAGIIAIGSIKNNKRHSFDIQDITTSKTMQIMSVEENLEFNKIGKFYINPIAFKFGEEVLEKALKSNANYIIIDEIGKLELNENGWFNIFNKLLKSEQNVIFTSRKELLQKVTKKFNISEYKLIETGFNL